MGKLAITGSTGFVGKFLLSHLLTLGEDPVVISRQAVGLIDLLRGCDVLVHLAGRAHVKDEIDTDPLSEYRLANVEVTLHLARNAVLAGVKRFVFISSIGVNGVETFGSPFKAEDAAFPHSPYAISKYEAELGLQTLASQSGMEFVIIRPPLVYGPNAPGNFGSLIRWLKRGLPLPLGAVKNKRSFVALENLVDLILVCSKHPSAANQTFLVSDGEDISTTYLLQRLGATTGKPARLLPVPEKWLAVGAHLLGKREMFQSLCGSLQVDITKTCTLLDWRPPISVDEGLNRVFQRL